MLFATPVQAETALAAHWRWPHFRVGELACHCGGRFCGGEYWHAPAFLDGLEAIRAGLTETATFAATAATLWWFGDRSPRRFGAGGS